MIRHFSSGGVVYRKNGSKIEFLLCKSSYAPMVKNDYAWGLPKGWLDDAAPDVPGPKTLGQKRATNDEVRESALREVREEAGVNANIVSRLGETKYFFTNSEGQKVFKTIIYFLMEYQNDIPEGFGFETSEISWVGFNQALEILKRRKGECQLLKKAVTMMS